MLHTRLRDQHDRYSFLTACEGRRAMICVIADPSEQDVVREFFELFKTPWEFYRRDVRYEVLLCTGDGQFDGTTKLVLFYAGRKTHCDYEQRIQTSCQRKHTCI